MASEETPAFGLLLGRYRRAAGLTQEELAEQAALSARAISDIERGVRGRPQPHTVRQLADALRLAAPERALFEDAAFTPPAAPTTAPLVSGERPRGNFLGALPSEPLVARGEEMAHLHTLLEAAADGTGQLVLLAGELGAGKTRLAQEVMVAAHDQGFVVGAARCYQGEAPAPCEPVLEALDDLTASAPTAARAEMQRRRHALLELRREGPVGHGADSDGVDQRVLFAGIAGLLVSLAEHRPVALLLDDLHWADDGTVHLVQYLAHATRGSRIFLLATVRDGWLSDGSAPLARALQDLSRERLLERISVRRMVPEETAALVATLMGQAQVSEEVAAFVQRRSKGNPRFVEQLVRALGGRLHLRREIGAGAMGRVFKAVDARTGQTVAAKLMLSRDEVALDSLLRFQQEGAVLAALSHPHIVQVHDTFVEEHASCIIMELLDGPSLGQLLQDGPLPLPRARHLASQIAEALAYAHAQGIVHRDIKPDNVMVLADDQVKVTDFGIARLLRTDTSPQTIATTGMRLGTPLYMAPEQIEGKKIDGRTDIYAFGALLYHMVTGQPPFAGSDAMGVAVRHLQDTPAVPSTLNPAIPADWDGLILKALQKDPARRFQTAREMEQAISTLSEEGRAQARTISRSRWVAATVGVLTVVLAAVLAVRAHPSTAAHQATLSGHINTYLSSLAAQGQLSGTVLVARHGTVVLDKGYGLADRAHGVPNTATTKYPVGTVGATFSIVRLLQQNGLQGWRAAPESPICHYLPRCPAKWRPITVRMVLEGTSHLPDYQWGQPGNTTQQTVAGCQASSVIGYPPSTDNDCDSVVLATLLEQMTRATWEGDLASVVFHPAGMVNSGRMTDALATGTPGFALDYDGGTADPSHIYNDFFAAYSTAPDLYAYDNALFGGKLLSPQDTAAVLAPRGPVIPPDPYVTNLRWGDYWRIGTLFGRRVAYTIGDANDFVTVNMRFPDAGVTVIVISNDVQNDTVGIALHAAALVFGQRLAPPPPIQTAAPPGLVGSYRRTFQDTDRRAAHDPGIADWVGITQWITIRTGWIDFAPPGTPPDIEEYYTATRDGRLTMLGYRPGNQGGFCSVIAMETPPTGSYRWVRQGRYLIITRTAFDPCLDRGALLPGRWTKVG